MPSKQSNPPLATTAATEAAGAPRSAGSRSIATLLLAAVLAICAIAAALRSANSTVGIDYYQFWAVGRAVARHQASDIYSATGRTNLGRRFLFEAMTRPSAVQRAAAGHRSTLDTTSTPFLYVVFSRLSTDDYESSLRWYRIFLLSCFVASTVGISKLCAHSLTNVLLTLSLLLMWFEPLASDLRVGNVSCLQLGGLVTYAYLRYKLPRRFRELVAGFWLGLLLAFKPNLVFVAAVALVCSCLGRKWRPLGFELGGIAVGACLAIGISVVALGGYDPWLEWMRVMQQLSSENIAVQLGNMAPAALWHELLGGHSWIAPVLVITGIMVSGSLTRRWAPTPEIAVTESRPYSPILWQIALGGLIVVLVPRLAWLHYFVLLMPALLLVLSELPPRWTASRLDWRQILAVLAWLGLSFNPFTLLGVSYTVRTFAILTAVASFSLLCSVAGSRHGLPSIKKPA